MTNPIKTFRKGRVGFCDCSGANKHDKYCCGCEEIEMPELIYGDGWEGYRTKDIKVFLGPMMSEFNNWFSGKTGAIEKTGEYCVYKWDFAKFLDFIGISIGVI